MRKIQFEELIEALELFSKQGESYADENGRHGWRNPIRADTGALLRSFVLALQPQRVLEIGTAHGLSALYLSSGWHHTEGVRLDTIEFDAEVAAAAQARMDSVGAPVRVLSGDASVVIPSLHDHYEVVFFDAQKSLYLRIMSWIAVRNASTFSNILKKAISRIRCYLPNADSLWPD